MASSFGLRSASILQGSMMTNRIVCKAPLHKPKRPPCWFNQVILRQWTGIAILEEEVNKKRAPFSRKERHPSHGNVGVAENGTGAGR
jgi:hypothetical protein